jgi:hypothetical protein
MLLRILHLVVIAALVLAAADVYKIKYESTLQAQGVVKTRAEIRREQDTIAALRAEWSKLERPDRVQDLVTRHLKQLKPLDPRQLDALNALPERPTELVPPDTADPIGAVIEGLEDAPTGSVPARSAPR